MNPAYLIHADGAFPNLALMTLAGYFKERGRDAILIRSRSRKLWDKPEAGEIYGSSIFSFSEAKRRILEGSWGPIRWGGTGVRLESNLAEIDASADWESIQPDYSGYPEFVFSIGFTQRGCRLSCKFCVVPQKEGRPRSVRTIPQLWRGEPHPRKIVLLDNDFFGQPIAEWSTRLDELRAGAFKVSFCQGINIRQVDERVAASLATVEYRNNAFDERILYTAWDNLGDEGTFKRGVATLAAAGIPARHLCVYMLIGYAPNETFAEILYRFNELRALGCQPYPMVYNNARPDLKAFQRWAVTGLYRAVKWEDYRDPRKAVTG